MQGKNSRRKILLISDAISGSSGLARIARDVATRIHANLSDVYELAVAGYGGTTSCKFGFHQYHLEGVQSDWVLPSLREIIDDFAGNERCIVMFIWDCSRLGWFSQPDRLGSETLSRYPGIKQWLMKANIEKWLYCPLDASGPNDKLTAPLALTLIGFDRLLAYGQFGEDVIRRTIGDDNAKQRHLTWLPHGIDASKFYEMPRKLSRRLLFQYTGAQTVFSMLGMANRNDPIADDEILVGVVATNQSRKNWPIAIETIAILSRTRKVRFWIHTDNIEGGFSIPSLLADYGLLEKTVISMGLIPDTKLASAYSACDLTLGIGPEGFGFPLLESQYCGTNVVHGSYAGGADIVPKEWQVDPIAFYKEGSYSCMRPVYRAEDWAEKANELIGKRCNYPGEYDWDRLWPERWEPYLREAAKQC
jgi:glycosyltransferase involved in cell wall biosynthesis